MTTVYALFSLYMSLCMSMNTAKSILYLMSSQTSTHLTISVRSDECAMYARRRISCLSGDLTPHDLSTPDKHTHTLVVVDCVNEVDRAS